MKKLNPFSKTSEEIEPSEENSSQYGSGQMTEDEKSNGKVHSTKLSEENLSRGSSSSPRFGMFLTLKVLFWDIAISLGDTVTDFAQAYALMADGKWSYGAVTLAINWIPGEF